jgi:flagellar motor switch protein FliM
VTSAPQLAHDGARSTTSADLLLQAPAGSFAADLLDEAAERLAAALQKQLRAWGARGVTVVAEPAVETTQALWRRVAEHPVFWQCAMVGFREQVEYAASRQLVLQLIDLHYGGSGAALAVREQWSPAELRFADAMGQVLAHMLVQPWGEQIAGSPAFRTFLPHPPKAGSVNWTDIIVSQNFRIDGLGKRAERMSWAIAASDLEHVAAAQAADSGPAARAADSAWLAQLHRALGQVSLPVRSVLARPEVSLGKILALQVGDVIPLKMPEHAPITVAGYSFAAGTIGEANGRSAICIETVRKGTPS